MGGTLQIVIAFPDRRAVCINQFAPSPPADLGADIERMQKAAEPAEKATTPRMGAPAGKRLKSTAAKPARDKAHKRP
jgi:hypothetical protein